MERIKNEYHQKYDKASNELYILKENGITMNQQGTSYIVQSEQEFYRKQYEYKKLIEDLDKKFKDKQQSLEEQRKKIAEQRQFLKKGMWDYVYENFEFDDSVEPPRLKMDKNGMPLYRQSTLTKLYNGIQVVSTGVTDSIGDFSNSLYSKGKTIIDSTLETGGYVIGKTFNALLIGIGAFIFVSLLLKKF